MPGLSFVFRSSLAAMLSAAFLTVAAVSGASAKPFDDYEKSARTASSDFAAKLRAGTRRMAGATAEAAKEAGQRLGAAQARTRAELDTWRQALSGQKEALGTLGRDAAARLDAWREATGETAREAWAELHHSALDVLNRLTAWLRVPPVPDPNQEIPV